MAKLVSKNQRIRTGVTYPKSVYSRVVALELHLAAGMGNDDYCYTPQLGNSLILYSIDVWAYCAVHGIAIGGFFYLNFGTGIPPSGDYLATQWNNIIPLSCGLKPGFRWFHCDAFHRRFTMAKFFETNELRFGVAIENGYNQAWEATVAFEISEG